MRNLFTVLLCSIILFFPSCKKEEIENPAPSITKAPLLKSVQVGYSYCTFEYDEDDRVTKIRSQSTINGNWEEHEIKYSSEGRIDSILNTINQNNFTDYKYMTYSYSQDGSSILLLDHLVNTWGQATDTAFFELNEDKTIKNYIYGQQKARVNNFYSNENRTQYDWYSTSQSRSYFYSYNDKPNPLYISKSLFGFFFIGQMHYLNLFLFSKNMPVTYTANNLEATIDYTYNTENQPTQATVTVVNTGNQGDYYFSYY
jgi:hypothetical protein